MGNKKLYYILGLIVLIILATLGALLVLVPAEKLPVIRKLYIKDAAEEVGALPQEFAPELEKILGNKLAIIENFLLDPIIIGAVRKSNAEHEGISVLEIQTMDERWKSPKEKADSDYIQQFLNNETAKKLLLFQETDAGFSEIFITDQRGLNVGQTNKTSDFYQADEEWWIGAYFEGKGKSYHGPVEFDESAQVEAISLYAPIRDPITKKAIGVAKAVINVGQLRLEL